jgi:hypothetical protein
MLYTLQRPCNPQGVFSTCCYKVTQQTRAHVRICLQCTALANCDLACLKAHDLVAAMRGFPETAAKVR